MAVVLTPPIRLRCPVCSHMTSAASLTAAKEAEREHVMCLHQDFWYRAGEFLAKIMTKGQ